MLNFRDANTTQKATGATSVQIDFVCVICTSNSSTAAVASLSLPLSPSLSLCVFVQGYLTQQYRHFSTCYFIFSQLQRSFCTNGIYSLLPQHRYRLRMCTCTSSSTAAVASLLSLYLSLCVSLFRGTSHNNIAISLPTLLFFRSYNEVFVQTAFILSVPSGTCYFSICDHGPDSLHAVVCDKLTFFHLTRGMLRRSRRLQIFLYITAPQSPPPTLEAR